jgi:branched-chain amino acid transport system ATP-binding protein
MSEALLEVRSLEAGYGEVQVLWGLSLAARRGQLTTIVGANGVGKTTSLRAIAGSIRPWGGQVLFDGRDVTHLAPHLKAALGLVLVPEGRQLFNAMSVEENLEMGAYTRRASGRFRERLDWVYGLFPRLKERRRQAAGTFSGGEQQMLAIARILRTGARFLMLDEPTEGLAPVIIQQIGQTIKRLKGEGFTILLVEQNFRFAATVADRYYIVEHGKIIDGFANSELQANMNKLHTYLGV